MFCEGQAVASPYDSLHCVDGSSNRRAQAIACPAQSRSPNLKFNTKDSEPINHPPAHKNIIASHSGSESANNCAQRKMEAPNATVNTIPENHSAAPFLHSNTFTRAA